MFFTFRGLANIDSVKYNFSVEILKPNFFRRILLNFSQDFSPIQMRRHMRNVYVCWQYDFSRLGRMQPPLLTSQPLWMVTANGMSI